MNNTIFKIKKYIINYNTPPSDDEKSAPIIQQNSNVGAVNNYYDSDKAKEEDHKKERKGARKKGKGFKKTIKDVLVRVLVGVLVSVIMMLIGSTPPEPFKEPPPTPTPAPTPPPTGPLYGKLTVPITGNKQTVFMRRAPTKHSDVLGEYRAETEIEIIGIALHTSPESEQNINPNQLPLQSRFWYKAIVKADGRCGYFSSFFVSVKMCQSFRAKLMEPNGSPYVELYLDRSGRAGTKTLPVGEPVYCTVINPNWVTDSEELGKEAALATVWHEGQTYYLDMVNLGEINPETDE